MNKLLLLIMAIVIANSCKTRQKSSNSGKALVSDDLRLSFKPQRPRVGEEFTVQIEILRDGEVVTDGTGSELTVQLSHRCGSNKSYSRAQLAEADDGVAEIELTIGTRRGQAMSCAFRAVAGEVTREKFSFKLKAGDNYRQQDHRHNHRHADRDNRHDQQRNDRQRHKCGQRMAGHRQHHRGHQQVTISKPVTASARGRFAFGKEFTIDNEGSQEVDIELVNCGNARLFRYRRQWELDEAECHTIRSKNQATMFIIGTVDRDCDFAIDGRRINFDDRSFSSATFGRPACPEPQASQDFFEEHNDVAFHLDNRQWQAFRQDDISRGLDQLQYDELLVRIDGWWCKLDD